MEFSGLLKAIILIIALIVPITIVVVVFKTFFSGLRRASDDPERSARMQGMPGTRHDKYDED